MCKYMWEERDGRVSVHVHVGGEGKDEGREGVCVQRR